jgi:hypothetical protein
MDEEEILEVELFLKSLRKDNFQIVEDCSNGNVLALRVINQYEFFRKCPGDRFGFFLAEEAYKNWKISK